MGPERGLRVLSFGLDDVVAYLARTRFIAIGVPNTIANFRLVKYKLVFY